MKNSSFFLLLLLGFVIFNLCSSGTAFSSVSDIGDDGGPVTVASRKLKENRHDKRKGKGGNINLEDYHCYDPVPSTAATVKHGPIEHGSPIIPYIPKHSPPPASPLANYGDYP